MIIFNYKDEEALGAVLSVDTATVIIKVADLDKLRRMQVNRLVVLQSSKAGQHLIGIIQKITRSSVDQELSDKQEETIETELLVSQLNLVRVSLIGTLIDKVGIKENVFRRTLETVPEIDAKCFAVEGDVLTAFMRVVANVAEEGQKLSLGYYTLDEDAEAYLNGNKFFQRHAIIVGSTGSGKSWTTARVLEQAALLPSVDALVLDIHGEYAPMEGDGIKHYRVAGPGDLGNKKGLENGVLYLPYWLLGYEALISMFVDRSDQNAPNQAMIIAREIVKTKQRFLEEKKATVLLENFTIDSPVPFSMDELFEELNRLNTEMVPGAKANPKQGDFHGKLSRMIARLENKRTDRRLGFLFQAPIESNELSWLDELSRQLIAGTSLQSDKKGGVKIIDFSEVPSDILPLIVSLVARLTFSLQQWTLLDKRHPIALFCDEAHLYIPLRSEGDAANEVSIRIFEKIAKEGRKYGVGLVIISQRPSEVNHTVLSQCNNLVAMRLTNAEDQTVVRKLLPDSLGGFGDVLPILDTGEALVVGDASLLPSRVRIKEPNSKPNSGTVDFWDRWSKTSYEDGILDAVKSWRKQNL